jgi:glutathione S-transferase
MITLYQFAPCFGLPSASPFCLKLETYLRMANLPYQNVVMADLQKAPKGKMPYITDQGKTIADSNLIIEYLIVTYGDRLDAHLAPVDRGISLAMRRLLEENLYWALVYSRWMDPLSWPVLRQAYFASLPPLLSTLIPNLVRRSVVKNLQGHGMGRHSAAEIYQIASMDIAALGHFLGDKPYFMGDRPSTLDASAYGTFSNILWAPLESPLRDAARQFPQLEQFCQRMKSAYYSEGLGDRSPAPVT